jgi:hypothetical protein
MKIFLKLSHGVAAIGEEDYLLVLLHSLRFEQFGVWAYNPSRDE